MSNSTRAPRSFGRGYLALAALFSAGLFIAAFQRLYLVSQTQPLPRVSPYDIPNFDSQARFWKDLRRLFDSNHPGIDPPKILKKAAVVKFDLETNATRPDVLFMPEVELRRIRKAHDRVVKRIKSDDHRLKLVYDKDTQGIVSAAGKMFLPTLVISLRMLRRTGSILPVEVFIASKDEYDPLICEEILPSLNAGCVVASDIIGSVSQLRLGDHHLKAFALLFSSFEDILWLDADCFPLYEPAKFLSLEPFTITGMVTWPAYGVSSTSLAFYDITSWKAPPLFRASSDGAQLAISKRWHEKTLLLMSYYTYYGPTHYFRLFSQAGSNEGAGETAIVAASVLGESFYDVREPIRALGGHYPDDERNSEVSAMVQHDPVQDYENRITSADNKPPLPRALFIHQSNPKIDLTTLFGPDRHILLAQQGRANAKSSQVWTIDNNNKEIQTLQSLGGLESDDIECDFWAEVRSVACELERRKFTPWEGMVGICERATEYFETIYGSREE